MFILDLVIGEEIARARPAHAASISISNTFSGSVTILPLTQNLPVYGPGKKILTKSLMRYLTSCAKSLAMRN